MNEPLRDLSSRATLETIPLGLIKTEPQIRANYDQEELVHLGNSLEGDGQMQPVLAYRHAEDDSLVLVAGHRRYEAAKLRGIATLKALVFPFRPTEGDVVRAQLAENTFREALNPMDLAFAYQKLMKLEGITATQLAERLHIATSTVTRALELTTLPEAMQQEIRTNGLKPAHARELAKIKDAAKQAEIRATIDDQKLSASQTASLVRTVIKPKKAGRPKTNEQKTWKCGGFDVTYRPGKKLVLVPTHAGKSKTPDQLIGALEQLLGKLKEELGRTQASATLSAHGANASEVFQTQH